MTTGSKALVLSGGGHAGAAWMAGLMSALGELGADLGEADLIVGKTFTTGVVVLSYQRAGA